MELDATDWAIISEIQRDARLSVNQIAKRVNLSAPSAEQFPEIMEIHRLTGSSCTMVRVRTASMAHLSSLLERIGEHADANSHVVLETPLEHQALTVPPPPPVPTRHPGWNR